MPPIPEPAVFYLPLLSPRGHPLQPLPGIAAGAEVQRGQTLAVNHWGERLHAPASGILGALHAHPVARADTPPAPTWPLTASRATPTPPAPQPIAAWLETPPAQLRQRLQHLGLVGLGGAAFPAARKWPTPTRLLVINALECEPGITADAALLTAEASAVAHGIRLLRHALEATRTVLALKPGLPCPPLPDYIEVQVVAGAYPAGAERLLLPRISGSAWTPERTPTAQGLVCHNVGTAYAVYQSLCLGLPPLGRWVSLSGASLARPQTLWALWGTPLHALLAHCGYDGQGQVRVGGHYSGYPLPAAAHAAPFQAHINALHAAPARPVPPPAPCIRCGFCATSCPVDLQPQLLYAQLQVGTELPDALQHCLVCGLCEAVCPSRIPLNTWLRRAKHQQRQQRAQKQQAAAAQQRHAARTARLTATAEAEAAQRAQRLAEHLQTYRDDPARHAKLRTAAGLSDDHRP